MRLKRLPTLAAALLALAVLAPQFHKKVLAAPNNKSASVAGPFTLLPQQVARLGIFNNCTGPYGLRLSLRDASTGQVKAHAEQVLPSGLGLTVDAGSGNDTFNLIGVIQVFNSSSCTPMPGTAQVLMLNAGQPVAVTAVIPAMPADWEIMP